MPFWNRMPYTDIHNMNLDWIINAMKELEEAWKNYGATVSAVAHLSERPEVNVTGDFKTAVTFDFGIVRGEKGDRGEVGPQGDVGPQGKGLEILDTYATLNALRSAHPVGTPGDAYLVGSANNFVLYIWSTSTSAWVSAGSLSSPSPSDTAPLMDGVAAAGTQNIYSRGDHRHPSDSTKLDKASNDGTITEVYAVAGTEQNRIKVTDRPEAGKVAMYDQVTGNLVTGTPVNDNDVARNIDVKGVKNSVDNLEENGVLVAIAEAANPTIMGYPSTGADGFLTFGTSSDGDPTIKATFDGYSTDGEAVNVYDQIPFDRTEFEVQNGHMHIKDIYQDKLVAGSNIKTINNETILGAGNIEIAGGGFTGINTADVLATQAMTNSAWNYTAIVDCWFSARLKTDSLHDNILNLDGVEIIRTQEGVAKTIDYIIPLKAGQTVNYAGGDSRWFSGGYTVYGLR